MTHTLWIQQSTLVDVPSGCRLDLQRLPHDRHKLVTGEKLVVEVVPGVRPVGLCRLLAVLHDMALQVRTDRPGKGETRTIRWEDIGKVFRVGAVFVPVPHGGLPAGTSGAIGR